MDKEDYDFHRVSRFLNKPKTIGGFGYDQVIPAALMFIILMACNSTVLGMILAASWFIGIAKLKKNKGGSYLLILMYWFGTQNFCRTIFNKTPPSFLRFWLN